MTDERVQARTAVLRRLVDAGEAVTPTEQEMPDLIADLVPEVASLTEVLVADRERDR